MLFEMIETIIKYKKTSNQIINFQMIEITIK